MKLCGSYFEDRKDPHPEFIERKIHMQISKKVGIYMEKVMMTVFLTVIDLIDMTTTITYNYV